MRNRGCIAVEMFCSSYQFSERNLFVLKSSENIRDGLVWLFSCFQTEQLSIIMDRSGGRRSRLVRPFVKNLNLTIIGPT